MNNVTSVSAKSAKQGTVAVHDDEAKTLIGLEKLRKSLCVELVVAKIERRVDGFEGFKIDIDLALLAFRSQNFTTVDD